MADDDRATEMGIPHFLYGTAWKEGETSALTKLAIQSGFRGIDTANQRKHYHEAGVGEAINAAIEEGLVEREELFVQTKFTYVAGQDHRLPYDADAPFARQVEQSFTSSLEHLRTDDVDSYILHGPSTRVGLGRADREVWQAMEELLDAGQVGAIGVSNVSAAQLQKLFEWAEHPPAFVQNRCFARTGWDRKVRRICESNGALYQGFSLLTANTRELRDARVEAIAERHGRTVPQIVFRFAMQVGMIPLTGTTSEAHMKQDLACLEFDLSEEELEALESVGIQH